MSIYKRRYRRDTLTGGTKDVNPQYMTLSGTQTGADTFTQFQVQIPIQRLQTQGRAQVMEVLRVKFVASNLIASSAAATQHELAIALTTKTFAAAVTFAEPTCFAFYQKTNVNAFTAGGTGLLANEVEPYDYDCTDGSGHGFLVASDNIFLQIASVATGVANAAQVKIYYRWKDVSIQEYVGIVQSQS